MQACGASLSRAFDDLGRSQRDLIEEIDAIEGATRVVPDMLVNARTALQRGGRLWVAVEPRFWGLSFRVRAGAVLAGLDVDWGRAVRGPPGRVAVAGRAALGRVPERPAGR